MKDIVRVAIFGRPCTGKTTILRVIQEALDKYNIENQQHPANIIELQEDYDQGRIRVPSREAAGAVSKKTFVHISTHQLNKEGKSKFNEAINDMFGIIRW